MISDVKGNEVNGQITINLTEKSRISYLPRPVRCFNPEHKSRPFTSKDLQQIGRRPSSSPFNRRVSGLSPDEHIPGTLQGYKVFHSSMDVSHIRSRIGSFENILYQPQDSNVKIFNKNPSYSHIQTTIPSPTIVPNSKPEKPVKIFNQKFDYSHVNPLVSYRENEQYTAGGGNVAITSQKLNFSEFAKHKIDSKSNHIPKIPTVSIPIQKLNFRDLATSRIDSKRDLALKETPKNTRHLIDLLTVSLPDLRITKETTSEPPDHFDILTTTPPQGYSTEPKQPKPLDNEL
ncbi:hypothetical protein LOD99_13727 [Oopsacas minuta]|uniref:Uncharacterized protein n=1 Tax=Oopsacas minuta TaxID=111878 RepID=A0AAV7KIM0_9METZ|nr:hypothetical protein LOD99_13727 [Oopsacas minuta]